MGIEIERKFLLKNDSWKTPGLKGIFLKQGYLQQSADALVRIRISEDIAYITVKGKTCNTSRLEFEYEIPVNDAVEMLDLCEKPLVEKMRYPLKFQGMLWVVDVFEGNNEGLEIAEIELKKKNQAFMEPPWLGREISGDPRYFNSNLIKSPYLSWNENL